MPDVVEQAREEFELVDDELGLGTSKLYARGDFLPLDDPRAFDERCSRSSRATPRLP